MKIEEYIKELSKKDKKTLSQKALKLVEEVGELARVVLPYDSAHGTNHRFIDREALLEEIADVHLTNISIAHSLGFTDDELNEMMVKLRRELPDNHPDKLQEGEDALPVVEVKIEQHGDMLYAFRKEDDQFLGQGRDREELIKRLQDGNKHTFKMLVSQEDGADLLQKNNT